MSPKLWTSASLLAAVMGTLLLTPGRSPAQQPPAVSPATPTSAPSAAPDAATVLNDPNVPQPQRDEAARRLLSRHTADARTVLRNALIGPNVSGQLAVTRALEEDPDPDRSFIDPLFPLLQNNTLAKDAGRALAGYKSDPEVLTRLIEKATGRRTAEFTRLAALRAIGSIPERRAAAALMDVLASDSEPANIHAAAADALTNMTGLDQNGQDPKRWGDWWAAEHNRPDADFRQTITLRAAGRLDRLDARHRNLIVEVGKLLRQDYDATPKEHREELVLKFLNSQEPDIREIGARIVSEGFSENPIVPPAVTQRLREMISDSNPSVRRAVAGAISNINDVGSLDVLLAQSATESDPAVRAAIARALGPIHDNRAVPVLLQLLSDDSLVTAREAALALRELAQRGPLTTDPKLARETAEKLRDTIKARAHTPGAEDLRAACIEALAPLHQFDADIVGELLGMKLLDPNKEPSPAIRRAMLQTVAEQNDKNFADMIVNSLHDPDAAVRLQAIESLKLNPDAPAYVEPIGKMLDPRNELEESVREGAWKFLQSIFPRLSAAQLQSWAERLKAQPNKRVLALQALADKQQAANALEDLAMTRYQIGDAFMNMKPGQFGDAAANFKAAMDIFNRLPANPGPQTTRYALVGDYMKALLEGGKYSDAVAFAADRIRADSTEQGRMGPILSLYAEQLAARGTPADLAGARQLIDLTRLMSPPLADLFRSRLDDVDKDIKSRPSTVPAPTPAPAIGPTP